MRQVCTWGHVALRQGMCRVTCGLRSLASSDALRGHVTRGPGGFLSTWGWALHPLIPRRVHHDPLLGVVP